MQKNAKKSVNMIVLAVAAVALLTIVAIAYAQGSNQNHMQGTMKDMMGDMDEMHKQMTEGLSSEEKGQMDDMHKLCTKMHKDDSMMD